MKRDPRIRDKNYQKITISPKSDKNDKNDKNDTSEIKVIDFFMILMIFDVSKPQNPERRKNHPQFKGIPEGKKTETSKIIKKWPKSVKNHPPEGPRTPPPPEGRKSFICPV